ncbi:sugar phosphate isomerase/epimerase [Brevibacillus ruminantium]|uniref:Sugar phosphate isomerase/epimerase n=1 Tax=Brevibacillus ruminantium TaxID=2950604 RepID=A0ABY4WLC4_9BACL|nr:sugar phosphate isomerase/epimerase [Brevibacillus ruminantium]USG67469.1 sugar phosphate isomerase/epimerase [Brevibacillus ruminantium]
MNFCKSSYDPATLPPRLQVHQSWWAMRGIGDERGEWSLEKKIANIAEAGYSGIMGRLPAPEEAELWRKLLDQYQLEFGIEAFPEDPDEFGTFLQEAKEFGVSYVNAQVKDSFVVGDAAVKRLSGIIQEGKKWNIPVFVETHRGRITQDLLRTVEYAEALPDLRFTIDFSHYVLAGEMLTSQERAEDCFQQLLKRTSCIHGRISNGQQIQVDIGPAGEHPMTERFLAWWKQGMKNWRQEAQHGDVLPFVCELGPVPYAIDRYGFCTNKMEEISNRWEQGLVLKQLALQAWREVQEDDEAGF